MSNLHWYKDNYTPLILGSTIHVKTLIDSFYKLYLDFSFSSFSRLYAGAKPWSSSALNGEKSKEGTRLCSGVTLTQFANAPGEPAGKWFYSCWLLYNLVAFKIVNSKDKFQRLELDIEFLVCTLKWDGFQGDGSPKFLM